LYKCHPERSFTRLYREKRSRRICGLLASATIPNRRSFDYALARFAQDDTLWERGKKRGFQALTFTLFCF
jgi:hypothetical protein